MIQPSKALTDQMGDSEQARALFEQMDDDARAFINLWASLDPDEREQVYRAIMAQQTA